MSNYKHTALIQDRSTNARKMNMDIMTDAIDEEADKKLNKNNGNRAFCFAMIRVFMFVLSITFSCILTYGLLVVYPLLINYETFGNLRFQVWSSTRFLFGVFAVNVVVGLYTLADNILNFVLQSYFDKIKNVILCFVVVTKIIYLGLALVFGASAHDTPSSGIFIVVVFEHLLILVTYICLVFKTALSNDDCTLAIRNYVNNHGRFILICRSCIGDNWLGTDSVKVRLAMSQSPNSSDTHSQDLNINIGHNDELSYNPNRKLKRDTLAQWNDITATLLGSSQIGKTRAIRCIIWEEFSLIYMPVCYFVILLFCVVLFCFF